jgi:streptogramin lyase
MKHCHVLVGCMLASICVLSGGARAQVVTEFFTGITAGSAPSRVTAGPDGNLWFTELNGQRIGRITPHGVITEFSAGISSRPYGIAAGPDGNMWFTEVGVPPSLTAGIGRITTSAAVVPSAGVPTLQQWGLWLLGLLILISTARVGVQPRTRDRA